jgi:hypothetical protein
MQKEDTENNVENTWEIFSFVKWECW